MKNVLVIVYYFPPMGGSGVQRPLKFVKYLREFGWNPIVLCPEPGAYHVFDDSLQKELDEMEVEVHRVKAGTPFHWLGKVKKESTLTISNRKAQILRWFSKLIYYPDNKKGWIKPAVKKGLELLDTKNIDVVFSSAPPFSNHLVASFLKKEKGVPVVLDYRDSWLNNHFMTDLFGWQKSILKRMEKESLESADLIVGLDEFMIKGIAKNHPEIKMETKVIPHGFDPDDFKKKAKSSFKYQKGKINFLYSGLFYESNQPDTFLRAIKSIIEEEAELLDKIHLHFQGGLDERILKLIKRLGLSEIVTDYAYVPHSEAIENLVSADVLWMVSNFSKELKQIKTGKLFEYIGTGKPIVGLVNEGEASRMLKTYQAGFSAPPNDFEMIKTILKKCILNWEEQKIPTANQDFINKFNRKLLTEKLASIFNVISA